MQMNEEGTIVQVTVADTERWYIEQSDDGKIVSYPSVTWITSFYPKGIAYYKWLAETGWNESQAIKSAAGVEGHQMHQCISKLLNGHAIKFEEKVVNPETQQEEDIELEVYQSVLAFKTWFDLVRPEIIANEQVVINRQVGYAGTLDLLCKIDKPVKLNRYVTMQPGVWLIDFKKSGSIWPSYRLQPVAYKACYEDNAVDHLGILQLNPGLNAQGFRFTEIDNKFDLFLAAKRIWDEEVKDKQPAVVDLPMEISLGISAALAKENPEAPKAKLPKPKKKAEAAQSTLIE